MGTPQGVSMFTAVEYLVWRESLMMNSIQWVPGAPAERPCRMPDILHEEGAGAGCTIYYFERANTDRKMQGLFVPFAYVRIQWSCEGLTSIPQQIHWIQLKHLLPLTMYNLSLPKLSGSYYRLPATVQLRAAHKLRATDLRYCTVPGYCVSVRLNGIFWDRSKIETVNGAHC